MVLLVIYKGRNMICYEKYNNCMRPNMQYIFFEVQQKAVDSLKIGIAISLSKKIKFNFSEIQQNEISKKIKGKPFCNKKN